MDKHILYVTLTAHLEHACARDLWLAEHDPATWQLVRTIDDWLVQYREDPRVGIEQYQRQCDRLRAIYESEAAGTSEGEHYGA